MLNDPSHRNRLIAIGAKSDIPIDFLPWTIWQTSQLIGSGELDFDVAIIHTTPPDANGYVSLGVSVDFAIQAVASAHTVLAEINPSMPYTSGENKVHVSQLTGAIEVNYPLPEEASPAPSPVTMRIGENVVRHVPDGATIEIGVGKALYGVVGALKQRNDLSLHTGLFSDTMIDLIESGTVTNTCKPIDKGLSVANQARGTQRLYRFVDHNPAVAFMPASYTHNPRILSQLPTFRAINTALEVDLMGRVNSEFRDDQRVASIGGLADFVRAARFNPEGHSIIALASTAKNGAVSRIVSQLGSAAHVTLTSELADLVVTEHGTAHLASKPPRERAEALIAIADPRHHEQLTDWCASSGLR